MKSVVGATFATPLLLAALPATAAAQQASLEQLQQQIDQLQSQVATMKAQQEQMKTQAEKQPRVSSSASTSQQNEEGFNIGGTQFKIGGYVKFDTIYDFDNDAGASLGPSDVRLDGHGDPHLGATAKQTRLTISTTTPTSIGDIGGYIGMDMYGGNFDLDGNYKPRVRQAYLTYGNWLFGKAWSTFSDFNYGTTLNFYGPQAQIFERQAQVRYTFNLANDSTLDVALETPDGASVEYDSGVYTEGQGNETNHDVKEQLPDVAVRYKSSIGNLSYQAAAIGRYLKADSPQGGDDSTFGYGLDLGGTYKLAATGTTFMLSANYGEGDAKYVYDPAGGADAYVDSSGDLNAIERYGYVATISQELAPKWTTNVVWGQGFSEAYNDDPGAHKRSDTLAINLLYNPVDALTFGVEYDRADLRTQDDDTGNSNWVQFSAIYNF